MSYIEITLSEFYKFRDNIWGDAFIVIEEIEEDIQSLFYIDNDTFLLWCLG
jgi:hypothetical protein